MKVTRATPEPAKPASALSVAAEALRDWQRNHGGESDYAPTTMFIDKAEQPAQAVLDALAAAGYSLWRKITPEQEAASDW